MGEELVLSHDLVACLTFDRQKIETVGGRKLRERAQRIAGRREEGVERAVLQLFRRLQLLQVLRLDVLFADAEGRQDGACVDERPGARLIDGYALALEIRNGLQIEAFSDDDVHALGIKVRDGAQLLDLGLAFVDAGAVDRPRIDVGLAEARSNVSTDDAVHVVNRAVGGNRAHLDLVGGNGVGDDAADRVVSAARPAGADAKEPLLGACRHAGEGKDAEACTEGERCPAGHMTCHFHSSSIAGSNAPASCKCLRPHTAITSEGMQLTANFPEAERSRANSATGRYPLWDPLRDVRTRSAPLPRIAA